MFNGFPGWVPPGPRTGGSVRPSAPPLPSSSPDRLEPHNSLPGRPPRQSQQAGYGPARTASPVRAAGSARSGDHLNRLSEDLAQARLPDPVQDALLTLLAAVASMGRQPTREVQVLVGRAQQAVTGLLAAQDAPQPRAAEAAARALMAGIAVLPHPAAHAGQAAKQFFEALQSSPPPRHAGDLPAYGGRLEATARAILTTATLVPADDLVKGLSTVAQLPAAFAQRIPPGLFEAAAPQYQKALLDHVSALQNAVLETVPALPLHLQHEPLAHLAGQLAHAQFGLHRAAAHAAAENLHPGLAVDLLAAVGQLPPQDRYAPLQALRTALLTTHHFSHPPAMMQVRQRLLQAVDELHGPVAADTMARLRQELRQQAQYIAQDRHVPGVDELIRQGLARMPPQPGWPGWQP